MTRLATYFPFLKNVVPTCNSQLGIKKTWVKNKNKTLKNKIYGLYAYVIYTVQMGAKILIY